MYVTIHRTCNDCDSWNKETKHCDEWNRKCNENQTCCGGAYSGMIPVKLAPIPEWLQSEVEKLNQRLAELEKETLNNGGATC